MKSSQALTQSVFGALVAFGRLDVLAGVEAEGGRPDFFTNAEGWNTDLEQTVWGLNEPRPTCVDVMLVRATGARAAVECKWRETEFGRYALTEQWQTY